MVITRTPLRISFFGGGTDYPIWYRENGGAVLATTIDKSCYLTCRWLPPFFDHHSRISYSTVENVLRNEAIRHPSVRGCLQFLGINEGVEVHHVADLPARTGLGTSSAFTVGLLLGLYALRGQIRDKHSLAKDAIFVEQNLIGEAVGSQDQVMASYGGFNHVHFDSGGSINVKSLPIPQQRLQNLERHLTLYFTGFARTASEVAKEQIRLTPQRGRELTAMQEMVQEAVSIITAPSRSLDDFGHLLHESWKLKRGLTDRITNDCIDGIYTAALRAGALGGKLLGAGGGGFMLFFVPPHRRAALRAALNKLLCIPFRFSTSGSNVVVYEPEELYDQSLADERRVVYEQYA